MHRPWRRAAWWLLILGPFFFMSYGAATLLAARHEQVGSIVYDWEHHVPFLPWTIVPYWSIDILYGISLFVCANEHELTVHVRRLFAAQVVCVACFIVFPLTFTFHRPPVAGLPGFLFGSLEQFDRPFNQAPSLHIALLVILWVRYAAHVARSWRWLLHVWFALIGVSVLTTWQHHFVDVPTGALVGFLCLWLWPDELESPLADIRRTEDPMRRRLAAFYGAGAVVCGALAFAFGGATLWLLWPAVSLTLVAAAYLLLGPAAFQKGPDGAMSLAARWLLAPYIAAAWLNSRLWTRRDAASAPVGDGVFIGRIPGRRIAFASVIDLCAELPGLSTTPAWRAVPMLDLVAPPTDALRGVAGMIERARDSGPVLVCCALGYGRSAAAIAAWLLITGRAGDIDAAYARIRRVRPRTVLRDDARAAIAHAARTNP